jgi:hypothetical protein
MHCLSLVVVDRKCLSWMQLQCNSDATEAVQPAGLHPDTSTPEGAREIKFVRFRATLSCVYKVPNQIRQVT